MTYQATEERHRRGLELLGLWPDPLGNVASARTAAAAALELEEIQGLARDAKRIAARRYHPDLHSGRGDVASLQAILAAAEWVAALKVKDVWAPRARLTRGYARDLRRGRGPVEVEVRATGIRISYRGKG